MNVNNLTSQDIYFGPLHLLPNAVNYYVDDTSATSLYLTNDSVADALNNAYAAGKISVSSQAQPFPRPTGTPEILHGDGSPEGLVFSSQGSIFMRRDNSGANNALYAKTTGIELSTGWLAFAAAAPVLPATTLPGTPSDGQQAILVDSTSAPTYVWLLQWNATAAKWYFIGGTPAYAEVTTAESPGSTNTYVALTTAGPAITLAHAGDYFVDLGVTIAETGNQTLEGYMSYDIGGTGAIDADATSGVGGVANSFGAAGQSYERRRKKTGLSASTTLTAKYKSASTFTSFKNRWMAVTPISVT